MIVFQDEGSEDYIPTCVASQYIRTLLFLPAALMN